MWFVVHSCKNKYPHTKKKCTVFILKVILNHTLNEYLMNILNFNLNEYCTKLDKCICWYQISRRYRDRGKEAKVLSLTLIVSLPVPPNGSPTPVGTISQANKAPRGAEKPSDAFHTLLNNASIFHQAYCLKQYKKHPDFWAGLCTV